MAYTEIEKESFLHKNGEERVFFVDKDARRRITDLEKHGGGGEGGGSDGYSPAVTITEITGGHRVTITDKEHPSGQAFDVMDGAPGTSPAISVVTITGGHRVTIGANSFDVLDGEDYVLTAQDKADIAALVDVTATTPRVAKASTDTTAALDSNKLYVFPEMASLTITLAAITDLSVVNEYHFVFESGATATVTDFPAIPGLDDFAAESNMAYEVSILEGRALVTSWEVSA